MGTRGRELITANKPTVVSEPCPDAIVVEDGQSNRCFPDSTWTDESDRGEVLCETNDLFDEVVAPETNPWRRGRRLSKCTGCKHEIMDTLVVKVANLV
jgi:hypothetical protein